MNPIGTHQIDLPPSCELETGELTAILKEILPGPLSTHLLPSDTDAGELYLPRSWIGALDQFARRRYHDDTWHENRLPSALGD